MSRFDWSVLLICVVLIAAIFFGGDPETTFRDVCAEAGGTTIEAKGELRCYAFDLRERINIEGVN